MISVLIPSRGHPDLLERSVGSLDSTATVQPEIWVRADDDDPATIGMVLKIGVKGGRPMRMLTGEPLGYAGLHTYYQEMADEATGDWLMVWNDDDQMLTPGWDVIIEALPPSVLIADVETPYSPLCAKPAIRREAIRALGKFSSANPHVDTFWQDVGLATDTIRTVPVKASSDSPIKPDQTHGFYGLEHQRELAAAIERIRAAFPDITIR